MIYFMLTNKDKNKICDNSLKMKQKYLQIGNTPNENHTTLH